jgi:hypothetical protein
MDSSNLNAIVQIVNGKLSVTMTDNGQEVTDRGMQIFKLRDLIQKQLENYEREHQQSYRPTKETVYKLPPEG